MTAVLLAALLLHEPLTATGAVGAVLVLGSVAGLALARPGRPPDAAPVRA